LDCRSPELGRRGLCRLEAVGLGSRGLVEDEKRLSLPSSRIDPYKKEDVFPRNRLELECVTFSGKRKKVGNDNNK
jgi:hypothetical protein